MNSIRTSTLLIACTLGLVACGDTGDSTPATIRAPTAPSATPAAIVEFADSGLEAAVRTALKQPSGPLLQDALLTLEELDASSRRIADLAGIEHLRNLVLLNLVDNRIADLAPLARLIWLQYLFLNRNQITDLAPLADLTLLEILLLEQNRIRDLGPLLSLGARGSLAQVDLAANPLSATARTIQTAALEAAGVKFSSGADLLAEVPPPTADQIPTPDADPADFRLLFQSTRHNPDSFIRFDLFVMDGDGGRVVDLFADLERVVNPFFATWSPDGEYLAFAYDGGLYTIRADGTDLQKVSSDSLDYGAPTYSPDGSRLAFFLFGDDANTIATLPVAGGPLEQVVDLTALLGDNLRFVNRSVFWSPDGLFIGFNIFVDNRSDIFVADLAANALRNLSQTPDHNDVGFQWSPDGQSVLFASNFAGDSEVYLARLDGAPPVNLTNDPAADRAPQFFPDGRRILFSSNREGGTDFFAMDLDSGDPVNITNAPGRKIGAAISPDGSFVATTEVVDGNVEIFVTGADGRGKTNITNSPGGDWAFSWAPR